MESDALAKFSARDAVDVMSAKSARLPIATFDVRRELAFDGAVSAHDNDAELQD